MNSSDILASPAAAIEVCNQLHKPLDDRVTFYADAARSSATHRAYRSDMAAFAAWGGRVPASPETVASYLAASDSLAAATLRRRLAAIADAHQAKGHSDPTKHPLVRKVLRGIRRIHGARVDAATPLDIAMLARIIDALPNDLTAIRDRALLLVGFFCALRRSELVALSVEDLDRQPERWVITIQRSKTDPYGHGQLVPLPAFSGPLCPTTSLTRWMDVAGIAEGPLYRAIGSDEKFGGPLPAPQVGSILRKRAAEAGVDVQRLSAHSLRSGFAVSAVRAGASLPLIRTVTRHATLAGLEPYVRAVGRPADGHLSKLIDH